MKLSKLVKTENLNSITIKIKEGGRVTARFFFNGRVQKTKQYTSLDIDIEVKEVGISSVSHLGIIRYRSFKNNDIYVNIYNYEASKWHKEKQWLG